MPEKTILFLDQYSGLSGGQTVLFNIIQAFSQDGYRCIAILPAKGLLSKRLNEINVRSYFLPIGYYNIGKKNVLDSLRFALRLPILALLLKRLIKKEKADIVYANGARTFIWATISCSIAKIPLFWHLHSIFQKQPIRMLLIFFGRFKTVKKIFAVSNAVATPLSSLGEKIEVVYNAVRISTLQKKFNLLKEEYGLKTNDFLISSVGILEAWKNQEDLINAAGYIKNSKETGMHFFIIGDSLYNTKSKQNYARKLKNLVAKLGLEKEITFTGFRSDIKPIMESLDVLVICSKEPDPCPLVSLEAAESAVAIISTDFGGTKEIFTQNTEALFYKPGDYKSLADKIIYLATNHAFKENLAENARTKVIKEHDLDNYLKRIKTTVEKEIHGK